MAQTVIAPTAAGAVEAFTVWVNGVGAVILINPFVHSDCRACRLFPPGGFMDDVPRYADAQVGSEFPRSPFWVAICRADDLRWSCTVCVASAGSDGSDNIIYGLGIQCFEDRHGTSTWGGRDHGVISSRDPGNATVARIIVPGDAWYPRRSARGLHSPFLSIPGRVGVLLWRGIARLHRCLVCLESRAIFRHPSRGKEVVQRQFGRRQLALGQDKVILVVRCRNDVRDRFVGWDQRACEPAHQSPVLVGRHRKLAGPTLRLNPCNPDIISEPDHLADYSACADFAGASCEDGEEVRLLASGT